MVMQDRYIVFLNPAGEWAIHDWKNGPYSRPEYSARECQLVCDWLNWRAAGYP